MEGNKITAITKEKTDMLTEAYKDTVDILDAYDHQTLARTEGTYYDENETIEEVAVNMLKGWQFLFLGANMDAVEEADKIGIRI